MKIFILGASGRMGKALSHAIAHSQAMTQVSSLEEASMVIDFSHPEAILKLLEAKPRIPLVIGTTGYTETQFEQIQESAKILPIFFSPNFSLLMPLCLQATELLGRALLGKTSIDILETHHIHKKDAPSGTALALKKAIDPKAQDVVQIHSIRAGDVVGEHTVIFECQGERLTISHTIRSRDAFAYGALQAASFLKEKPPGLYTLQDLQRA